MKRGTPKRNATPLRSLQRYKRTLLATGHIGFADLARPKREPIKRGRPKPDKFMYPRGHASGHWLAFLSSKPGFDMTALDRQRACGKRYRDKNEWDQRVQCKGPSCPACVTKFKAKPWKAQLLRDWGKAKNVWVLRVSADRVPANLLPAAIKALRAQVKSKLVRSKAWLVRRAVGALHVDMQTSKSPGYTVHLHFLLETKPGFDPKALKAVWPGSYLEPLQGLARHVHYMVSTENLVPGYRKSKSSGRYEAATIPGSDLYLIMRALKGQRRLVHY
jgi:hypothetical protein